MKTIETIVGRGGLAAICGGALLVGKRFWDYFARGHVLAHTGYPDKDLSDYMFFLVPLLMLVAFVGLWHAAGGTTRADKANLIVGVSGGFVQSGGEFGDVWMPHGMPWGFVGSLGFVLLGVGLLWLGARSLRRSGLTTVGLLALLLGLFIPLQLTAVMLPYHLWEDKYLAAQAGLAVVTLFGLCWVALGCVLWSRERRRRIATQRC